MDLTTIDKSGLSCYTSPVIGQYTAVYVKRGGRFIGYIEEFAGVNAQARTLAQAKRNLRRALAVVLDTNQNLAPAAF